MTISALISAMTPTQSAATGMSLTASRRVVELEKERGSHRSTHRDGKEL